MLPEYELTMQVRFSLDQEDTYQQVRMSLVDAMQRSLRQWTTVTLPQDAVQIMEVRMRLHPKEEA